MKKILILGGSFAQLPFIIEANKRGYYTVLVDYLDDNPGQQYANEYFNLSTTDKEGVLELALRTKPDVIYSYASDPAAPTVAYVADKLGLKYTNSPTSVNILGEKNRFKEFLKQNGFNVPNYIVVDYNDIKTREIEKLKLPFFIKPTDSSGSKGVSLVTSLTDLQRAIEKALTYSRNKVLIAEEYIDTQWRQIHGDIFVENGEIIFSHLGDHHFDVDKGSFVPYSTSWPSTYSEEDLNRVCDDIKKVLDLLEFHNGPINVEARIKNDEVYLMELGPRNGGNFVPLISEISTGFNMINALFNQFERIPNKVNDSNKKYSCYYVLRTFKKGILKKIECSSEIENNIIEKYLYKNIGDNVNYFSGANEAIGILLMTFENRQNMSAFYERTKELIKVDIL